MIDLLEEAMVETFDRLRKKLAPTVQTAADWIRDVAEPPVGVRLVADDGSTYTGFAVFERSKPVVMVAVKHEGRSLPASSPRPIEQPPYRPSPHQYAPTGYERWEEDGLPFR